MLGLFEYLVAELELERLTSFLNISYKSPLLFFQPINFVLPAFLQLFFRNVFICFFFVGWGNFKPLMDMYVNEMKAHFISNLDKSSPKLHFFLFCLLPSLDRNGGWGQRGFAFLLQTENVNQILFHTLPIFFKRNLWIQLVPKAKCIFLQEILDRNSTLWLVF